MNHSDPINELSLALAKAQGKFQAIKKSKTVEVNGKTKDGRDFKYKYAYAPLDEILSATRPALSENGLAIIQTTEEGDRGTTLKTMLVHGSGQWVASYKTLGHFEDPQKFGGALTYYRRYEISAILGISSEEDDDANGAVGNEVKRKGQADQQRPNVNPETGEVTQTRQQAPQPRRHEEPKPPIATNTNEAPKKANGDGKKSDHPSVAFWKSARAITGMTDDRIKAALAQTGNDYDAALDMLSGVTQLPANDTLGFMDDPGDGGY